MSISKLRIGKDITIKMSILTNGEPVSLDGRDISVVLKTPMCQEVKLNFTIEDNIIISKYEGTKQKYCGIYMLTVWENYGKIGQSALDFCNAFELVSNTCKEVPTSEGLEIETITLEGDLSIGIQGASAYEVAVANGFKGTETEWLEWLKLHYNDLTAEEKAELQKPITDIAADVAEAERQRQQAEEIRRSAEVHRTGEEEKRVTAEDGRKTAEDARVTAETERVSAEVLRGEAEVIRAEAETSRVTAESKRSEAEAQRMTGEDLRKVAEQNRTTAEQARVSAEAERVKAESARVTAEQQRAEAEQARTEAEQQRNTAEAQRIGAEISRTEAEVQRAAAEQQRAEAEQSRVAAEANRQQQTTAAIEAAKTATASATSATAEAAKAVTAATNATMEASEAAKLATDAASKTSTVDYAVCTTAATIADKEINIAGFALGTHCRFLVKMSHIAETEDVKLSVRSGDTLTEPKPLTFNGAPASVNNTWRAGDILDIYYDGSSFHATHYMGGYGITEINVSEMCPKGGHNGTNKYTLAEAIKKIPEAHQRVGFKCSFINDNGEIETAVYQGGTWENIKSWKRGESGEITTKYDRLCWMNAHGQKLPLWPQTTLWSLEFQFAQESNYLMLNTLDDATKMGIKIQIGYVSQAITYYLNGELKTVQLYQFESLNHTVISYDGYTLRVYYSGVLQAEDLLGSSYDFRFPEKFTAVSTAPFAFLRTYNYPITEDIFRGGACRLEPLDWSRRNAEPEILSFSVKGVQPELSKITFPRNIYWQEDFVTYNGNRVNMNTKGKSLTTLIAHITTTKESFLVHHLTNNPCLLIGYNNGRPLEKVSNGIKLKPGENTVISVGFSYSDYKITSESAETEECIMYVDCITSGCVRNYDVINADQEYIYDDCMGKKYKCKSIPSRNSLASSVVYGPNQPKYPYFVGQIWINPTNESSYICVDIMKKLWKKITS